MEKNFETGLRNLPNLDALLQQVEEEHVHNEGGPGVEARRDLVHSIGQYRTSRFRFGAALHAYRVRFVEDGGWLAVVKIVADAIDCDEGTIRRILADYERASQVPTEAIKVLEDLHIDPAAKKNEDIIKNILVMDRQAVEAAPQVAVSTAVKAGKAQKAAKKAKAVKPSKPILANGTTVVVLPTPEERKRRDIKRAIRAALANVPPELKLRELIAALEEEVYEEWGQKEPVTITLTPHPSALALRERHEQAAAA